MINNIKKIHEEAKKSVKVSCDEYHEHNANCLTGDINAVNVCKLCEYIYKMYEIINKLQDIK